MRKIYFKIIILFFMLTFSSSSLIAGKDMSCQLETLLSQLSSTNDKSKRLELTLSIQSCIKSTPNIQYTISDETILNMGKFLRDDNDELVEIMGNTLGLLGERSKIVLPEIYGAFVRINHLDFAGSFYSPNLKLMDALIQVENKEVILKNQNIKSKK